MNRVMFLFSGEGTMHEQSGFTLAKSSTVWSNISQIISDRLDLDIEELWNREIGRHRCPESPLLTVICQICIADIWRRWGYRPELVVGHSIGELSAAYEAGLYSLEEILLLSYRIGKAAAKLEGAMSHGTLPQDEIDLLKITVSSENFHVGKDKHITVSGPDDEMQRFLVDQPDFTAMRPPHPWHHPGYSAYADDVETVKSRRTAETLFVSGITGGFESHLHDDYWQRWLCSQVNFIGAFDAIRQQYAADDLDIIEIGFHPVLEACCEVFDSYTYASSMYRGEDEAKWILFQRRKLRQASFLSTVTKACEKFRPGLDLRESLAFQDFTSRTFVEFAGVLEPFFPGLAPQDFYRFKTVEQLLEQFGAEKHSVRTSGQTGERRQVVIVGMSCKFPADAENPAQFWQLLIDGKDQVRQDSSRGDLDAGFLSQAAAKFDHRYFRISEAEARTMDPQQILALELAEMTIRDAGIDLEVLDRKRVGVYLGVWNEEYRGDSSSVYYPTGTNPSIIASRISYHYDLRGPSWVSNTACSSSLVALHYAAKDIEAGRVDYAIAGGVNMILGNTFTSNMKGSGFLSKDGRCKTFDNSANGYVRSEGGGLVLLAARELVSDYYAVVAGSSINQNGGRAQVITAPHPEAQEEVILDACMDAGIEPGDISYIECHGTGTKIGDPIEISAIQNTIAKNRADTCYLGSVKSNIGHLESAAGIAGLIKALLVLNKAMIPADLHFDHPNEFIDFDGFNLEVVSKVTPLDPESYIGVSSFGFGGANGHVVLAGAPSDVRKPVADLEIPFDRNRAAPLTDYYRLGQDDDDSVATPAGGTEDVRGVVEKAFYDVTNIKEIELGVELTDQGLDSLGATQFVATVQQLIGVELDPDLLFDYPLMDQLVGFLESVAGAAPVGPRSGEEINELISRIFYEVTSVRSIERDVELTDQGLDSLSAAQFVTQLESSLGLSLDADILFDYPLVDPLCAHLVEILAV
jgi:acyl transferase domain-containing protein/acyl carrier protein